MKVYVVVDYQDNIQGVFSTKEKAFKYMEDQNAPPYTYDWLEFEVQ